jgi:hypothetical protein
MRKILLFSLISVIVACGGGGSSGTTAGGAPPPASRNRVVISRAEIDQATWATDAFVLVQRLRPNFFRTAGPSNTSGAPQIPVVRLNEVDMGEIAALRQIQPASVQEIRFYTASEATARFGGIRGRPVIHVISK